MGQSGILETDNLTFVNSTASPKRMEVVMGRCFPLSGPGFDSGATTVPVVKKIIYKNNNSVVVNRNCNGDSQFVNNHNNNRIPVLKVQQQNECDDKKTKPIVIQETSKEGTKKSSVVVCQSKSNTQNIDQKKHETSPTKKTTQASQAQQTHSSHKALPIDSDEIKRISNANSPRFKVKHKKELLATPEVSGREAWEATQKKKAELREEFFRVPYEECNKEALRGMGARLNKSEPKLNTVGKERKKRNSLTYKRRVHFNMDDSQLEDFRKWKEERRLQAIPQCIKTVARIYSIDAPSNNQRQIEAINSFGIPKAEVPVMVSIEDSPPMRNKTARPTDLDSLQNTMKPGCSRTSISKSSTESRENIRKISSSPGEERLAASSQIPSSNSKEISREPHLSNHNMYQSQTQSSTSKISPSKSFSGSVSVPPSSASSSSSHRPPTVSCLSSSKETRPSDTKGDSTLYQRDRHQNTHTSPEYSLVRTRSVSPLKSWDTSQDTTIQKPFTSSVQPRQSIQQYEHPTFSKTTVNSHKDIVTQQQNNNSQSVPEVSQPSDLSRPSVRPRDFLSHHYHSQSVPEEPQPDGLSRPSVRPRDFHSHHYHSQTAPEESQPDGLSRPSVRPRDFHPQVLQPVPLPRSKSLSSKRGVSLQETSRELDNPAATTLNSKTFVPLPSRRATSLDRALMSKRSAYTSGNPEDRSRINDYFMDSSHPLKSPGLILNHLRSPTRTSTSERELNHKPDQSRQNWNLNSVESTHATQNSPHSLQWQAPTTSNHTHTQVNKTVTSPKHANVPNGPVNIIRSYTYPNRNQVNAINSKVSINDDTEDSTSTSMKFTHSVKSQVEPTNIIHSAKNKVEPTNITHSIKSQLEPTNIPNNNNLRDHQNINANLVMHNRARNNNNVNDSNTVSVKYTNSLKSQMEPSKFLGNNNHENLKINANLMMHSKVGNNNVSKTNDINDNISTSVKFTQAISSDLESNKHRNNNNLRDNRKINANLKVNNNAQKYFKEPSTMNLNKRVAHEGYKENEEKPRSKKTNSNSRGDSVDILMTKGESYSKHHLVLSSHMTSMAPKVTVKKILVPVSSTTTIITPVRSAPSPTPSCASSSCSFGSSGSSSGCFSGSPSPTPTPSPTRVRASGVPTDL